MRVLDLDLDFFLNRSPYRSESQCGRQCSKYKPWSAVRVRHFIEERCGLSRDAPVQGRTVERHDEVFDFWRTLIESGNLRIPFEVIHIDAHPDLLVGGGLYLASEFLYVDSRLVQIMLSNKHVHSGSYLTFAIARGWIASLIWIPLRQPPHYTAKWDGDARSRSTQFNKRKENYSEQELPALEMYRTIPFQILPWRKFRAGEIFNYITFSRSPEFTPPESDELVPVIEEYIRQI